jgi:peptidoglycan/xylan/chitin deacetylase (PgdA/CDA1 family)
MGEWDRRRKVFMARRSAAKLPAPSRTGGRSWWIRALFICLLASIVVPLSAGPAAPAAKTTVSLTFDNNTVVQYRLGYQQALQPHAMHATFFINSGTVGASQNFMTWTQLQDLAAAGNEIGGKTVSGTNLKTTTDYQTKVDAVCNDRQAILQHGLQAVSFAYPGGSFDATAETIVRNCGYGNARTAGSLSPTGPTYAEKPRPKDYFAERAYAPSGQVTLANMEALVNGAASHGGGGWTPIVISKVCSQALDPTTYSTCTTAAGFIELADLNAFLDWIQNAGQTGGAPAGTTIDTVRNVVTATDTSASVTTISCNGSSCASTAYSGSVSVALLATDPGSAVSSTHYTTDGSTPTLSSPTYTSAFTLTGPTTVRFRSWDNAGNVEAVHTQTIQVQGPTSDTTAPVTSISCNSSPCSSTAYAPPVTIALSATDSGSGVASTRYTTDGTDPSDTSTLYSSPFTVSSTTTVKFRSWDNDGNVEAVRSQTINVATPPPTGNTTVSMTFDDGRATQYTQARSPLAAHGMHATFYLNSGTIDKSYACCMTWAQAGSIASDGNEIGGHTYDHKDLTASSLTYDQAVYQVCHDRDVLISHGFNPVSFAYPAGAYNRTFTLADGSKKTAKDVVRECGYSSGRGAGGITPTGPYAETLPPPDAYATRTVGSQCTNNTYCEEITAQKLEDQITATASHGGGWLQFVFHEVCPDTDNTCLTTTWRPIKASQFSAFLDWLANVGQPGGAPSGTTVKTVNQALNA